MPKFFINTNQIHDSNIQIVGEDVKHISQVLRAKLNDELLICDKETNLNYRTKITKITPDDITCTIIDYKKSNTEPKVQVTIFQGIPKADKMEYIIQKNTEIGAKEIVPVMMSRCIVKLEEKEKTKKVDRWQKIAEAAAKQSGRDHIATIAKPIELKELCNKIPEFDLVLLAYENEENITLKQELKKFENTSNLKIGVIIGPEGGIDKSELEQLIEVGARRVTLGNRILRTETASLVIMSNIIYEYEM